MTTKNTGTTIANIQPNDSILRGLTAGWVCSGIYAPVIKLPAISAQNTRNASKLCKSPPPPIFKLTRMPPPKKASKIAASPSQRSQCTCGLLPLCQVSQSKIMPGKQTSKIAKIIPNEKVALGHNRLQSSSELNAEPKSAGSLPERCI